MIMVMWVCVRMNSAICMGMWVAVRMCVSGFTFYRDFTLTAATGHTHIQSPLCTNSEPR
jgi:hypothetical protein